MEEEQFFHLIDSGSTAEISSKFVKVREKATRASSHIGFLSRCLRDNLKPRFVSFWINSQSSSTKNRLGMWMTRKWLDSERRHWHGKRDLLSRYAYYADFKLAQILPYKKLNELLNRVNDKCRALSLKLQADKIKKLERLRLEQSPSERRGIKTSNVNTPKFQQESVRCTVVYKTLLYSWN